ncbi:MAG: AbrB/MazE/SpoVT family DNA-binding domain-containing protein [Candidatus Thorarchaeota archaeon]
MKQRSRKLQRVGDSYHISLPIDWIRRHDLKKGDRLKIEYDESDTLTVKKI